MVSDPNTLKLKGVKMGRVEDRWRTDFVRFFSVFIEYLLECYFCRGDR
jgi:hypothetical protein